MSEYTTQYIPVSELIQSGKLSPDNGDYKKALFIESQLTGLIEFETLVKCYVYESGDISICHMRVFIEPVENIKIQVWYDWSIKEKFNFHIEWNNYFKNMKSDSIRHIQRNHKEPNYIGKMSAKKLNDWIGYLCAVFIDIKQESERKANEKSKFLDRIKDQQVIWISEGKRGYINSNGLEYSFTIDDSDYIDERLIITDNIGTTFDRFLKLSDNAYKTA